MLLRETLNTMWVGERTGYERKNYMEIKEISVPLQGVVADYMNGKKEIQSCFDYLLTEDAFKQRLHDLREREFFRQDLVTHLLEYNTQLQAGEFTIQNIKALEDENTYVVIAGQQAGLLTGPLYTVHKIISILQLAKEKEESLGVRVVPVFWIAGEDHDMDEINHTFVMKNKKIKRPFFMIVIRKRRVLLSLSFLLKTVENGSKRFLKHIRKRILQRMYYNLLMML